MISRRYFLVSAAVLGLCRVASAQTRRLWRIGYLAPGMADDTPLLQAFIEGLRVLGYTEGQDIVIEHRSAEGRFEALPTLAQELALRKVDLVVAPTTPAARAAKAATSSIPVVFTIVSDPVGSGLVESLAHPGGNVTGISDMDVDLAGKRLDLLKQVVPRLKRIGALGNPADRVWEPEWREAQAAAQRMNIELVPILVNTPKELEAAFSATNRRVEALLVAPQAFFAVHRRRLIDLATERKLPTIHERKAFPEAGALMSYGPSYAALFRKAAGHVDKILKGTKPADLPVEQPTEYELVINLKTAKTIGLRVPQPVLMRADEVIE